MEKPHPGGVYVLAESSLVHLLLVQHTFLTRNTHFSLGTDKLLRTTTSAFFGITHIQVPASLLVKNKNKTKKLMGCLSCRRHWWGSGTMRGWVLRSGGDLS